LHLGNLRTALLAWLFARSAGGRFLLRVEDLDAGRARRAFEGEQLADLRALGLDWDGPAVRQSERHRLYAGALDELASRGLLYECFCTRAEIRQAASAPHGALPEGAYPGTCRALTEADRRRLRAAGRRAAHRLRAEHAVISFEDRLLGSVSAEVDDLVVQRGDGAPAYNLAVVVDDAAQGVTEVVRGADLAETTPRQVFVAGLLGLPTPDYAHVPLVLGADGTRLAKRHGAVTLRDRSAVGQSPREVLGLLAQTLGLAERGEAPTPHELLGRFDPRGLPRCPIRLPTE
jgi:glutamyl-tRNA synthetase